MEAKSDRGGSRAPLWEGKIKKFSYISLFFTMWQCPKTWSEISFFQIFSYFRDVILEKKGISVSENVTKKKFIVQVFGFVGNLHLRLVHTKKLLKNFFLQSTFWDSNMGTSLLWFSWTDWIFKVLAEYWDFVEMFKYLEFWDLMKFAFLFLFVWNIFIKSFVNSGGNMLTKGWHNFMRYLIVILC